MSSNIDRLVASGGSPISPSFERDFGVCFLRPRNLLNESPSLLFVDGEGVCVLVRLASLEDRMGEGVSHGINRESSFGSLAISMVKFENFGGFVLFLTFSEAVIGEESWRSFSPTASNPALS